MALILWTASVYVSMPSPSQPGKSRLFATHTWQTLLLSFHPIVIDYIAGAHRTWFHLYRLVLENPQTPQSGEQAQQQTEQVGLAVEQFLQTSTVGEWEQRLDMLWSFRSGRTKSFMFIFHCSV